MQTISLENSDSLENMEASPLNTTGSNDELDDDNVRLPEARPRSSWYTKMFIISIFLNTLAVGAVAYFLGMRNGSKSDIVSLTDHINAKFTPHNFKPNSGQNSQTTNAAISEASFDETENGNEHQNIETNTKVEEQPSNPNDDTSNASINVINRYSIDSTVEEYMGKDLIIADRLDLQEMSYWNPDLVNGQQPICEKFRQLSDEKKRSPEKQAVAKFSIPCTTIWKDSKIGIGNWIDAIYAIRMAALTFEDVGVYMECKEDVSTEKLTNILPWLMGYFPSWNEMQKKDMFQGMAMPLSQEACSTHEKSPIGYMALFMQYDLRRMAIAIAGIPQNENESHPSSTFAEAFLWNSVHIGLDSNYYLIPHPQKGDTSLVPDLELDEVSIQFACSYALSGSSNERVAFLKYNSYRKRISPDVQSIGILTANHKTNNNCYTVLIDLKDYLNAAFPDARVTLRNTAKETQAIVYTRLIMANQTFGGATSFGALPVVATFGNGYLIEPRGSDSKNHWVELVTPHYDNINFMLDEERLDTFIMKSWMRQTDIEIVRYWLTHDSQTLQDPYPPEEVDILEDIVVKKADLGYNSYWLGPTGICNNMDSMQELARTQDPPISRTMFNFTINCHDYFKGSALGTGNWISAIYGLRIAAFTHGGADIHMACEDAEEEKTKLILPWLMGYWAARDESPDHSFPWPHPDAPNGPMGLPSLKDACGGYYDCPVGYMTPFIRYDLRRMAIAVGGLPHESHPVYQRAKEYAEEYLWSDFEEKSIDSSQLPMSEKDDDPLVPGIEYDDAVIHFRCGDIMGGVSHPSFGFMKFTAYKKWLSPEAKSIGIVTNPFSTDAQHRGKGSGSQIIFDRCRTVVGRLKTYLEHVFPTAKVSVRNDDDETIVTSYVRLIMGNQTFASISSFGVFPVVATFGAGYLKKPDFPKVPNQWIGDADNFYDDIILMNEPERLMSGTVKGWLGEENGMDKVLYWFENEDFKDTDAYPPH